MGSHQVGRKALWPTRQHLKAVPGGPILTVHVAQFSGSRSFVHLGALVVRVPGPLRFTFLHETQELAEWIVDVGVLAAPPTQVIRPGQPPAPPVPPAG